jgi:hypothetical protein
MSTENIWGYLTNQPGNPFIGMLTEGGVPEGNCEATGNYLAAPVDFAIGPELGVDYLSLSMKIFLTQLPPLDKDSYGQIVGGIANGVEIVFKRGDYERVLNPDGPIKDNTGYVIAGGRFIDTELDGGTKLTFFEFDFLKDFGSGLILHGVSHEQIVLRLNDDFTDLDIHCFAINGRRRQIYLS